VGERDSFKRLLSRVLKKEEEHKKIKSITQRLYYSKHRIRDIDFSFSS
jgi:hypothetical protein